MQKYTLLLLLGGAVSRLSAQQLPAARPPAASSGLLTLPATPPPRLAASWPTSGWPLVPTSAPVRQLPQHHLSKLEQYVPGQTGLAVVPPITCVMGVLPGSRVGGSGRVPAGAATAASLVNLLFNDFRWQRYQQQRAFTGRDTDPAGYLTGRPQ